MGFSDPVGARVVPRSREASRRMAQIQPIPHPGHSPASSTSPIGVGLLGCGTVGTGVARLLLSHAEDYSHRLGRPLALRRIAVRDVGRNRGLPPELFTQDYEAVIADPDTQI